MEYSINERQRLLQQSARKLFDDLGGPRGLEAGAAAKGYDPALWAQFAELGWLGLLEPTGEPEGPDAVDAAVLVSEFGRALAPAPFTDTAILAMHLLSRFGGPGAAAEQAAISRGERIWAIAHLGSGGGSGAPTDDLVLRGGGLSGTRYFVAYGEQAQRLIVTAADAEGGLALAAATPDSATTFERLLTLDERPQVVITLYRAPVLSEVLLLTGEAATAAFAELQAWGAVMASAEMAGAGERVLELTLAYLKDRLQFGRPIGSFQATQHQAADMSIDVQAARVLVLQAAWYLSIGEPTHPSIAAAKGWASDALHRVVDKGHQLHGAIGFTLEHDMQRFYRRAKTLEVIYGAARDHQRSMARARLAELGARA